MPAQSNPTLVAATRRLLANASDTIEDLFCRNLTAVQTPDLRALEAALEVRGDHLGNPDVVAYTTDLTGCARCRCDGHAALEFRALTHPVPSELEDLDTDADAIATVRRALDLDGEEAEDASARVVLARLVELEKAAPWTHWATCPTTGEPILARRTS